MTLQFHAEAWARQHGGEAMRTDEAAELQPEAPIILDDGSVQMATDQLVRTLIDRRLAGEDVNQLAYVFHRRLAEQIAGAMQYLGQQEGIQTAALSGGVFQNRLLMELTVPLLERLGFRVLTHSLVPPNDGGIALGQAVYAMHQRMQHMDSSYKV